MILISKTHVDINGVHYIPGDRIEMTDTAAREYLQRNLVKRWRAPVIPGAPAPIIETAALDTPPETRIVRRGRPRRNLVQDEV